MRATLTKNKIIGLDMDGVIIDHTVNRIRVAKELGYALAPEETASDVMKKKVPKETYDKIQKVLYDDPAVAYSPPVMLGAKEGLESLRTSGTQFYLISRRKNPLVGYELLKKRELWPRYFNETNTFFVKTKEAKEEKAKELGVVVYLDDQPSVLEKLVSLDHRFLFDTLRAHDTYAEYDVHKKIRSWPEFIETIQSL